MGVRPPRPRLRSFLSPAGAGLVLICFFLPWVRVSCGGKEMIISGHNLGGAFWIVLGASAFSLFSFFYFQKRRKIKNASPFLLAGTLTALGIILYKYISIVRDPKIPFYIPASAINVDIKFGAIGTILGLLMVGAGSMLLRSTEPQSENTDRALHKTEKEPAND